MKVFATVALVTIASCAPSTADAPRNSGVEVEFVSITVVPATVSAFIVDKSGRRCGRDATHQSREIPGCHHQMGWEEGTPSDTAETEMHDPPPVNLFFELRDSSGHGVVHEGGCMLELGSERDELVSLALTSDSPGFPARRDTMSVAVQARKPMRLRLTWTFSDGKNFTKIDRTAKAILRKR